MAVRDHWMSLVCQQQFLPCPKTDKQKLSGIVKEAKIVKARDTLDVALYCRRFQRLA